MENNYTSKMEDSLYNTWGDYDLGDDDFSSIIEFLNNTDRFRSFNDGLNTIIALKIPKDSNETAQTYLLRKCKEKDLNLNRNTVNNWFSGNRPKKGTQSREHMFILAFALSLSLDETANLFHKVYLDRAFNLRSISEFVYFYCLKNGYTYQHAQGLINKINPNDSSDTDKTIYTSVIVRDAQAFTDDEALISYIISHHHNFQLDSKSAKEILYKLLLDVRGKSDDKEKLLNGIVDRNCGIIIQESDKPEFKEYFRNKDVSSINYMLEIILGISFSSNNSKGTESFFKNVEFPQIIKNRFPMPHTFSKIDPSFEELRKMIVLLFSYKYWFYMQYKEQGATIDDYISQIDDLLINANLPQMYYGNPFDWLFLFCTMEEMPLDTFRSIMAEVIRCDD